MSGISILSMAIQAGQILVALTGLIFCLTQTRYSWHMWLFALSFMGFATGSSTGLLVRLFSLSFARNSGLSLFNLFIWGSQGVTMVSMALFIAALHLFLQEFRHRGHRDERVRW